VLGPWHVFLIFPLSCTQSESHFDPPTFTSSKRSFNPQDSYATRSVFERLCPSPPTVYSSLSRDVREAVLHELDHR